MSMKATGPVIADQSLSSAWWTPRLAGPIFAAAVVRLTLLAVILARMGESILVQTDTKSYLDPGINLLRHGSFVADGAPDLLRTPGYPLFLAVTSFAGLRFAALANVILSVLCVLLIWKLGRAIFQDDRIALGAAWILAFEPLSITYSFLLITEPLFLTLLLLSLERMAAFLRQRRLPMLAISGLWLAAATFVRPVTYYLPAALALGLFVVFARVPKLRWQAPAVLLICVLPWLGAWQVRNWVETGYRGFSSVAEVNLYFFNAADVTARVEHKPLGVVRGELGFNCALDCDQQYYLYQPYLTRNPLQAGWNQSQRLDFMLAKAQRVIQAHRGVYLRGRIAQFFTTIFRLGSGSFDNIFYSGGPIVFSLGSTTLGGLLYPGGPNDTSKFALGNHPIYGWLMLAKAYPWVVIEKLYFGIAMFGLYFFAARSVYLATRSVFGGSMHGASLWLLLGTLFYFFVVIGAGGGTEADARLRLPIVLILCILASAGLRRTKSIAQ